MLEAAHISVDEQAARIGRVIRIVGLAVGSRVQGVAARQHSLVRTPADCPGDHGLRALRSVWTPRACSGGGDPVDPLFLIVTAVIFAFAVVLSALLRVITLPTLAASQLRRITITALQPVVPLMYRLVKADTRDVVLHNAYFFFFYGLLVGVIHWLSPDAGSQWPGLRLSNLWIGAVGFIAVYGSGLAISASDQRAGQAR